MAVDPLEMVQARALARLEVTDVAPDAGVARALGQIAIVSDFAVETLVRQPDSFALLRRDGAADGLVRPTLEPDQRHEWPVLLRRYRAASSTRLIWRDALGLDDVDATLAGSTQLAEDCLQIALAALEAEFEQRHGVVRDANGKAQRLVVFGLGKLGGGELNFSSDIDLVYAFESVGESDGPRPLAAEEYFARLGQQLAKLLDEVTADGFSHRVDLRLRPFGSAGRIALSFAAMEQYFQREGRDWERYAWQKARPVAGDLEAGARFLSTLRPFVYRRYLDYGALDGLRTMKASIDAEVARRELADDIKRGPGGIREIEFLAQALQLIRGGREPALQERRLIPALRALINAGQVEPDVGDALIQAYRFLRRLENRLQMLRDAQTHVLPEDPLDRLRIARGMNLDAWKDLLAALMPHRERVSAEFQALLAPRGRQRKAAALVDYWQALPDSGQSAVLADAGFNDAGALDASLRDFARVPGVRELSDASRTRLNRVVPALLQAAADSSQSDLAARRVLTLMHNILRRGSYLALLDERPAALSRLVEAVSRSGLLAERLAAHPLLLDELLDSRVSGELPGRAALSADCEAAVAGHDSDTEAALQALNEKRQALSFRIGLATLDDRQPATGSAMQLAWLADAVLAMVVRLASDEVTHSHGHIAGARFAILGYGSLGGEELGFGSDLDVVFLYDAPKGAQSDGARALDAPRWFARLAQKIVALLGTETGAGKLYEVDVRLRPDGASGLLVSTLDSYADYQRARAWTWEHQALVRARCVAGDASLCADFEHVRSEVLSRARAHDAVAREVGDMRRKMRGELDRSTAATFDLKQGGGGLVDLEFLLQALVLREASVHPDLCVARATPELIAAMRQAGVFDDAAFDRLLQAHAVLMDAGLRCTLDRRPRLVELTEPIASAREAIRDALQTAGLDFDLEAARE